MANNKTGLSYFSIDTDRYQDRRIKRLKKVMGCKGLAVYDYLLCEVYRDKGCVLVWDEDCAFDVAEYLGLTEKAVQEIVGYCGLVGLFDEGLLSRGIITSASIQKRYLEACARAKRKDASVPKEWCLIEIREESQIITEECAEIREECPNTTEVCDKEKKSKVKEIKEKERVGKDTPAPTHDKLPEGTFIPTTVLFEQMTADAAWLERVAKNTKSTVDAIRKELSEFCEGLMLTEDAKELTDARRHFISWRRKRQQVTGNPVTGGRPYRMLTYEQMLNEMGKNGTTMAAYTKVVVSGKEKPLWVTKADKLTYNIPDEL